MERCLMEGSLFNKIKTHIARYCNSVYGVARFKRLAYSIASAWIHWVLDSNHGIFNGDPMQIPQLNILAAFHTCILCLRNFTPSPISSLTSALVTHSSSIINASSKFPCSYKAWDMDGKWYISAVYYEWYTAPLF